MGRLGCCCGRSNFGSSRCVPPAFSARGPAWDGTGGVAPWRRFRVRLFCSSFSCGSFCSSQTGVGGGRCWAGGSPRECRTPRGAAKGQDVGVRPVAASAGWWRSCVLSGFVAGPGACVSASAPEGGSRPSGCWQDPQAQKRRVARRCCPVGRLRARVRRRHRGGGGWPSPGGPGGALLCGASGLRRPSPRSWRR